MKSEHRHELKTNELGKLLSRSTPFFEKYANYFLIGLGVVIVIGVAAIFISGASSAAKAGWTAMASARDVDDYAAIADKYAGKPVGAWARLSEAQTYLDNGIRQMFSAREAALSDLNKASELFKDLVNDNRLSQDLRQRALFGLARCTEATSDGNTEPAVQLYEQLVQLSQQPSEAAAKSIYQELPESRVAVLKDEDTKDFYAWFHKQDPKPVDRSQPQDGSGLPPGHPPVDDLQLPPIPPELELPKSSETKSAAPEAETPDSQPGGTPAVDPPADAQKADTNEPPAPSPEAKPAADSADKSPPASE